MRRLKESDAILEALRSRHVLFACEGTAEQVIIQCLCEAGKLIVSPDRAVRSRDGCIGTTHPEIEALILVREQQWRTFEARRGSDRKLNASDWCAQRLDFREVKKREFFTKYWSDLDEVRKAICDYTSLLGGNKADHLRLSDLLK